MLTLNCRKGSRRRSSVFPTIVESEESGCEIYYSEDGHDREGENVSKGKTPNELLAYHPTGRHEDKYNKLRRQKKNIMSVPAHNNRQNSCGTQLSVPAPFGTNLSNQNLYIIISTFTKPGSLYEYCLYQLKVCSKFCL